MKYEFNEEEILKANEIAQKEFEYWEKKKGGGKQCTNKVKSCLVGIYSEMAVAKHIKNIKEKRGEEAVVCSKGLNERELNFKIKVDCDIEVFGKTSEPTKIEVKGITKGQRRGQVLCYHGTKYRKNNVDYVIFCEVEYIDDKVIVEVYLCDSVENILLYPIDKNKYYKDCFSHPDYKAS